MTIEKQKLLKGKIIIALHEVLGRKPTEEEIKRYYVAARVLYSSIIPAFFERQKIKRELHQLSLV